MSIPIFSCAGGTLVLPDSTLVLLSRADGGNLVVNPPKVVWERSELTRDQLMHWSFLVAAAGSAMLEALPQLEGGCINYWEAGNWALNNAAEPKGAKAARDHRKVHLHLLGRSRTSTDPSWTWGESPVFPRYHERKTWSAGYERLNPEECQRIVKTTDNILRSRYGMLDDQLSGWSICVSCGYPVAGKDRCPECES